MGISKELLVAVIAVLTAVVGVQGFIIYMFVCSTKNNKAAARRIQSRNNKLREQNQELIDRIVSLEEKLEEVAEKLQETAEECEDYKYAYAKLYKIHSTLEDNVNDLMNKGFIIKEVLYRNAITDIVSKGWAKVLHYKDMTTDEIEAFFGYLA